MTTPDIEAMLDEDLAMAKRWFGHENTYLAKLFAEHRRNAITALQARVEEAEREREAFIRLLDAADRFNGVFSCRDRVAGPYQGQMMLAVSNAYRVLGIGRTEKQPPLPEEADLRTQLATLRAAIGEAVRRAEHSHAQVPAGMSLRKYWTEPLRNLDQPEPTDWFAGNVDVDGNRLVTVRWDQLVENVRHAPDCAGTGKGDEHCTCGAVAFLDALDQPEDEDALVEATGEALGQMRGSYGKHELAAALRKALASRGLVRGEGVER